MYIYIAIIGRHYGYVNRKVFLNLFLMFLSFNSVTNSLMRFSKVCGCLRSIFHHQILFFPTKLSTCFNFYALPVLPTSLSSQWFARYHNITFLPKPWHFSSLHHHVAILSSYWALPVLRSGDLTSFPDFIFISYMCYIALHINVCLKKDDTYNFLSNTFYFCVLKISHPNILNSYISRNDTKCFRQGDASINSFQ